MIGSCKEGKGEERRRSRARQSIISACVRAPRSSSAFTLLVCLPPLLACSCIVTKSSYTENEDFSGADAIYDCIGEAGEERFSLSDLVKMVEAKRTTAKA